jgi:hypothetical protein
MRRKRRKYLSVHGGYDEFRVVCVTKNCLQIRQQYFNVFKEYAKSVNRQKKLAFFLLETQNGAYLGEFSTKTVNFRSLIIFINIIE